MTERAKKYLYDILYSIDAIDQFLLKVNFIEYQNDLKTQSAVERQLGIIGEAVNKFSKENPDFVLQNSREIVNFKK